MTSVLVSFLISMLISGCGNDRTIEGSRNNPNLNMETQCSASITNSATNTPAGTQTIATESLDATVIYSINESIEESLPIEPNTVETFEDWYTKYLEYDWIHSDGTMISSESEYMTGPQFTISFSDLNFDGLPEVILSQKYSNRTLHINDVYSIRNGNVENVFSFVGTLESPLVVYEDNSGSKTFICENTVYQNSVESRTTIRCSYSDDFKINNWTPLFSVHTDNINNETRFRDETDTDWFGDENKNSKLLTEEQYNNALRDLMSSLFFLGNAEIQTGPSVVHYNETIGENLCTSQKELAEILYKLYLDYNLIT